MLRVPFFLEPDYDPSPEFEETNRTRLVRKWGVQLARQKASHGLKSEAGGGHRDSTSTDREQHSGVAPPRAVGDQDQH